MRLDSALIRKMLAGRARLARIVHLPTGMRSGPAQPLVPKGLTAEYLRHHRVCPIGVAEDGAIRMLAAPDAQLGDSVNELSQAYGAVVRTEPASWSVVSDAIASLGVADLRLEQGGLAEEEISADLRDLASQPPVVRYVNRIIREAVDAGASDVHLEAVRDGAVARLRIDGALATATGPAPQHREAVLSRLKLLAGLDIADTRTPQDGRLRVRLQARELDIRVSTVPSMHGESVVLRLLDRSGRPTRLEHLGLSTTMHAALRDLVQRSHGLVLVTGPTGSGKTTTLYAALHDRDLRSEKVITVEDPIEYELQDVVQVPVNRTAGVTFSEALRSLLRQDPDVMLIGELRDRETTELAIQAALTGHQVFSTLHTNDAWTAIPRLMDLGVAPYLLGATINGVLAQRLVRRNCTDCLETYRPTPQQTREFETWLPLPSEFVRGAGCLRCRGTGFRGRTGVFELLLVDDRLRDEIASGSVQRKPTDAVSSHAGSALLADGFRLIQAAQTTIEELLRVART